jgi:hypothetical protein
MLHLCCICVPIVLHFCHANVLFELCWLCWLYVGFALMPCLCLIEVILSWCWYWSDVILVFYGYDRVLHITYYILHITYCILRLCDGLVALVSNRFLLFLYFGYFDAWSCFVDTMFELGLNYVCFNLVSSWFCVDVTLVLYGFYFCHLLVFYCLDWSFIVHILVLCWCYADIMLILCLHCIFVRLILFEVAFLLC